MISKILCATDGSETSDIPVVFAAKLAARVGAELSLIAVNVLLYNARGGSSHLWEEETFNEIMEQAGQAAEKAGMGTAERVKAFGTYPASTIIDYADRNGFDHIVVGGPRVGVARIILGSVASEVAAKAHCAVTIAR